MILNRGAPPAPPVAPPAQPLAMLLTVTVVVRPREGLSAAAAAAVIDSAVYPEAATVSALVSKAIQGVYPVLI